MAPSWSLRIRTEPAAALNPSRAARALAAGPEASSAAARSLVATSWIGIGAWAASAAIRTSAASCDTDTDLPPAVRRSCLTLG